MSSFCKCKSYSNCFSKNISIFAIFNDQSFNDMLTNDIVSFKQLVPGPEVREADTFKSVTTQTPGSLSFYLKVIYRHWGEGGRVVQRCRLSYVTRVSK